VLTLGPDRVAMFSYAHVPWLKKQQGAFAMYLPEGMEKFHIFQAGLKSFLGGGYQFIGMDHFARPKTNWPWRSAIARCIAISWATPPRPARRSTAWA
jgi:coproporphyrinogen III oxidase-like Fe-S oxidoreductase